MPDVQEFARIMLQTLGMGVAVGVILRILGRL